MISVNVIILLMVCHFIGDFLLQSDKMAQNKSKSNAVLLEHVLSYGIPFSFVVPFLIPNLPQMYIFLGITIFLHFIVDYITSRITSKLWADKEVHWFFVVIGFDQLLHFLSLILLFGYLI